MKLITKIVAVLLVACTALSLTACGDTTWVYNYNGKKVASGLYIAFTMDAYSQAKNHADIKTEIKDLFKQTIEKKTAKQWIIDKAKTTSDRYIAIENLFDELKLTLTETDKNIIKNNLDTRWEQVSTIYEPNGVSKETYELILTNQQKSALVFKKYYGTGGIEEIPADNLLLHFKENFADINVFSMPIASDKTLTAEQKTANEEIKAKAEAYIKMINEGGKSFNYVADDYAHVVANTKHDGTNKEDVIQDDKDTKRYIKKDSTSPSEKVVKAIFNDAKPDGEAILITDDTAYYICKRYDVTKDPTQFDEMRDSLLSDIKGEDFNEMIESLMAKLTSTTNDAAIKRYNPKNIDIKE